MHRSDAYLQGTAMNVLISACLLGMACRYDGKIKTYEAIDTLMEEAQITFIPVCPEQAGGLATPRVAAERSGKVISLILDTKGPEMRSGKLVITADGKDVTAQYEHGAAEALRLAVRYQCAYAVLKERSPSCGSKRIYDGTFTRTLRDGTGVTAALLTANGITVFDETETAKLLHTLRT